MARYGMVAALCEEVHEPARQVPRAMVLSVAAAAVTGLVYLVSFRHRVSRDAC
jgi:amino acid transporter